MKLKMYFFIGIISIIIQSCNLQYLDPNNQAVKKDFLIYQIHLIGTNTTFQCPLIYDAIYRSGGKRLGIRGIINMNSITNIAQCLREKPDIKVFLYAENAIFNETNKKWPERSFTNVTNITGVYFPSVMTEIGESAFSNCINLETIILGSNFNTMYSNMLGGVTNLKNVVYYGSRLDFTGGQNGSAWTGIPAKQAYLYLGNFDSYTETTNNGTIYTTTNWAKYEWKKVYYKGEFNIEDIIEVIQ